MKRIIFPALITIFALVLNACGAEAVPTMNPVDVQNTAVSAAFTLVAQTQAAIPTATPPPPTETPTQTPLPTETLPPLPTSNVALASPPASVSTSSGDPCDTRILSWSPKGKETKIQIVNLTKASVTVSLYLNETKDHFECGYRSYSLGSRGDVTISDLVQGCYNLWAFNSDPKVRVNASGYGCINNPDKWTFQITQDNIKFVGP